MWLINHVQSIQGRSVEGVQLLCENSYHQINNFGAKDLYRGLNSSKINLKFLSFKSVLVAQEKSG